MEKVFSVKYFVGKRKNNVKKIFFEKKKLLRAAKNVL